MISYLGNIPPTIFFKNLNVFSKKIMIFRVNQCNGWKKHR